jgi:uncharacterized SAM-binding protein YcdF (DUF218 family)
MTSWRSLGLCGGLLVIGWGIGFGWYVYDVSTRATSANDNMLFSAPVPATTAILVLTGGSERIATGLNLLQTGVGTKLFVSGAGAGADYAQLFAGLPRDPALEACCIALGHQAGNTVGNAAEAAAWLAQNPQTTSMVLVTAHYHMLRSMLEFRQLLPAKITLVPYPVAPLRVPLAGWWQRPQTISLLATEYTKLLFTIVRYGWYNFTHNPLAEAPPPVLQPTTP